MWECVINTGSRGLLLEFSHSWEFSGSPVVSSWCFHWGGPGWIRGWGTKVPQATQANKKKFSHSSSLWQTLLLIISGAENHIPFHTTPLTQPYAITHFPLCTFPSHHINERKCLGLSKNTPSDPSPATSWDPAPKLSAFSLFSTSHHRGPIGHSLSHSSATKILKLPNSFSENKLNRFPLIKTGLSGKIYCVHRAFLKLKRKSLKNHYLNDNSIH